MTNYTSEIRAFQQLNWYFKIYKKENKKKRMFCYLFYVDEKAVGFGFIRKSQDKFWITGGLSSDQRGKGLGAILFRNIVESVQSKEVWLEVLVSNTAARKIYEKLGFKKEKVVEINSKEVVIMKLTKNKKPNG